VQLAQVVHLPLGVAGVRVMLFLKVFAEGIQFDRRVEHAVVEQLVEEQRMARDEPRCPARGADDARDAAERRRVLRQ
jgi:hypothetical protein